MSERLQQFAVIGICLALFWIAYELHDLNHGTLSIDGLIEADCHLPTGALKVEIKR